MTNTIVFYDTEFTTWEGAMENDWSAPGQYREMVQIGAVRFDLDTLTEVDEFQLLVKPVKNPVLSDFFCELTGISNEDVVKTGDGEDLADVGIQVGQGECLARVDEPLLGCKQEPEAGARDVAEAAKIESARVRDPVEDGFRRIDLGGVETAFEGDHPVGAKVDVEHLSAPVIF